MITIYINEPLDTVLIMRKGEVQHDVSHLINGEELISAVALFINTKKEMEEDNGK